MDSDGTGKSDLIETIAPHSTRAIRTGRATAARSVRQNEAAPPTCGCRWSDDADGNGATDLAEQSGLRRMRAGARDRSGTRSRSRAARGGEPARVTSMS